MAEIAKRILRQPLLGAVITFEWLIIFVSGWIVAYFTMAITHSYLIFADTTMDSFIFAIIISGAFFVLETCLDMSKRTTIAEKLFRRWLKSRG